MAMNQTRVNQLADRIRVIVAEMLERRVKDPRLGFVTVTEARLTGDLRDATVFYTVFGGDQDRAGTAAALTSATGLIRSEVGKQLGLRHTPSLAFVPDGVPENAAHIDDLLRQARESDAEVARRASRATYAGESDPYWSAPDDSDEETQ
ncbi:MAG TPA: 30S ribosome-binding factor RbfA [Actinopolymorphaceae bacterium]|nr:30S ribosome-binding factor RbfA [Actinopolymorphaceae bacterium]